MSDEKTSWWGAHRTITNTIENRKISWLELFSDLVYVVIIHRFLENLN
ncbi:low temperature requirement protein A [Lactobacillus salsicarnum]|uniref:Low temperature requirement protein A n=1 Tax=Companilactobacillus mishanensis TaxID=2486008 RepID=A0A5P0ZI55_9LACO|nr:low temperature requirement protein A [Companilactobacillus mishanensis]